MISPVGLSHKDKKGTLALSLRLDKQRGPGPAAFFVLGGSREGEESVSDLTAPKHQNSLGIYLKEPEMKFLGKAV